MKATLSIGLALLAAGALFAQENIPITNLAIGENREFVVNGKPFLPIMGWLQAPANLPQLKEVGINTIAGYWRPKDGSPGAGGGAPGYDGLARDAGLYFIPPFDPLFMEEMKELKTSSNVLCWIHHDEPDMPETHCDAQIEPVSQLIINKKRPLYAMVDGVLKSSAVIDPMVGASFTVRLTNEVTVTRLSISSMADSTYPVPQEVSFYGDGKLLAKASLARTKGPQKTTLEEPATFRELRVSVDQVFEGTQKWGAVEEIEALDENGKNVLLSPVRKETRESPAEVMARYNLLKELDSSRPMMMTVTCFFINDPRFDHWSTKEQSDALYPDLLKATDILGFDVYPIYGWNQPDKLGWVSQGVRELRAYGGTERPVYAWLECLRGDNFGDKAHPVTGVEIRNEAYQAICSGATAIGYFTHRFKPFAEFAVPPENQAAMKELNAQLQRLVPAILGPDHEDQPKVTGSAASVSLAKGDDDDLILFVVNMDVKGSGPSDLAIKHPAIDSGTIEVLDEDRKIEAENGEFTDRFEPLAVHIYRVR